MTDLFLWQYIAIGLIFVWTGFVRSGLGFGGAALGLPLLLLVVDQPLIFLPIIGVHLLFFTSITVGSRFSHVDWAYLKKSLGIMILPKLAGVFGLLNFPNEWLVIFVYSITLFYGLCFLFKYQIKSQNRWVDTILLIIGAYISGTSLIGAPLIVAVYMHRVAKEQLRDTLFVLWFILVTIKFSVFVYVGVNFWWIHHLWLLPCAGFGHWLGLRFHTQLMQADTGRFKQVIGAALVVVCVVGLIVQN